MITLFIDSWTSNTISYIFVYKRHLNYILNADDEELFNGRFPYKAFGISRVARLLCKERYENNCGAL